MSATRFTVESDTHTDVIDITDRVRDVIPEDAEGTCTVFVRHTTAGITVNEAEPRLLGDLSDALGDLIPDSGWDHDELDGNADSHVRAMFVGPSETIPVRDGDLDMGTWQSVLFVDCDGPRERAVDVVVTD
ncbi:secondary thiamine-phosphate synthase enzyme [Haloarcula quadrata]|jgi:secondary thiamine-phosphate synthase enzyme|nr:MULTISPECIES: secondary thiamine-phosphate synthase enzyme YjbQ [Haloarcula]NHN65275.1 YjbQ family protein [Haloarcula sp. JP-Z28]QUJ73114.1 secondary thiamine-phosphate synthase enzyme YjbQ [Haloarcula sinaiiensis ATCC 33800]RKS82776.1 secondary thiamine-phosphate synthase enzyme [Haloarcula quadrata]